jgi:hypothetical protein
MIESRWTPTNQQMVAALREEHPELRTGGKLIRDLEASFPEALDDLRWFTRIPDAYAIRQDDREVDVFEVEVTHPIPLSTVRDLTRLWFDLDSMSVKMTCYVVNRYGHINVLDLRSWYYEVNHAEMAHSKGSGREVAEIDQALPREDGDEAWIPGG